MPVVFMFIAISFILMACQPLESNAELKPVPPKASEQITILPPPSAVKKIMASELNGKKFYKKCAACHQSNGDGITGIFPKLNTGMDRFATSEAGRSYLVLVIYNGLRGALEIGDDTFNGVMMRQAGGKSASDVADVLNYILNSFYPNNKLEPFTADEVQKIKDSYGRIGGDEVLTYRRKEE